MDSLSFSIIIPAYNASMFIERAVNSVVKQHISDWELIIVENGSNDGTYQLCERLTHTDARIKLYRSEKGVSNARNLGIDKATGKWVVFLDADDELLPNALSGFDADRKVDLCVGKFLHSKQQKKTDKLYLTDSDKTHYLCDCLKDPTQRCTIKAFAVRRDFLNENDIRFDPKLSYAEDSLFFVELLISGASVMNIPNRVYHSYINKASAVHTMNMDVVDKYKDSINLVEKKLSMDNKEVESAFHVFVLSQLLVILVNGVFACSRFKQAVIKTRMLCEDDLFSKSIKSVKLDNLPLSRKLIFWLMGNRLYSTLGIIIRMRVVMNSIKSK